MIAIDFETHLISKDAIFPKPICLSSYNGNEAKLYRKEEMQSVLKDILQQDIIIAHNAVFECGVIYNHFPLLKSLLLKAIQENRIVCTKINSQLDSIRQEKPWYKFDLASLVLKHFNTNISESKTTDSWRLRYNELENIEVWPQEAIDYSLEDSIWAYKLFKDQPTMNMALSVKAEFWLNLMGSRGMYIDQERVKKLEEEILLQLEPHYNFLISKDLCHKDGSSVKKYIKQLKDYIIKQGFELRYTAKGVISVDGESLEFYLTQKDDKVIKAFKEISIYEKVLTAYIARMTDNIIFSQYSTVKTTGRTSSNGSKLFPSLNIQQLPREVPNVSYDVRNCFVPPEGFKIVSIDYAGLELASTAHQLYKLYGKSAMKDVINSGIEPVDMHSILASKLKGCTYEEFIIHKKEKEYKDVRQLAKPINLGFPGGIGYDTMRHLLWMAGIKTKFEVIYKEKYKDALKYYYFKLRDEYPDLRIARLGKHEWGLVQDELVYLKRQFFDLYPELETFLKDSHTRFETGKSKRLKNEYEEWEEEPMYAYNIYGFKRDWCTYTAFCNGYLMQSPSATGAKKAVIKIMETFHDHPDVKPLAFIHDEIVFAVRESRTDLVDQCAEIMINEMQSVLNSVRITVEASMMDQWQKSDGFWTKTYSKKVENDKNLS